MVREIVNEELPRVKALCESVLGGTYHRIERLGGLTNHSYHVFMKNGKEYVIRIPGDGTEELINREDEKNSTKLACELDIDAQCLYFGHDGSKVTEYIPCAITMSAENLKEDDHIRQIAETFCKLHSCGRDTGVAFEVFQMASGYEKIIMANHIAMYADYGDIKSKVMAIKKEIDEICNIRKVPCHNDPLCENWITQGREGRMYLIDWEYAGMNDGMWDLADVSIEAGYDRQQDEKLLREYMGRELESSDWQHLLASKIYVDFLWTLWAKTRVPYDGQTMEEWADERYARLKTNIEGYEKLGDICCMEY